MKIGNKHYDEIIILTPNDELLACITDEEIIEEDSVKVELVQNKIEG